MRTVLVNFPRLQAGTARPLLALFILTVLAVHPVYAIDLLAPFKSLKNMFSDDDEVVVWEDSGQYVKIVEQDWEPDHRRAEKNDHPARIDPTQLAMVLVSLQGWAPEDSPDSAPSVRLFTDNEATVLAPKIAEALQRTNPGQDIVFGIADTHPGMRGGSLRASAARLFVVDGRLNIIFGDILRPVSTGDMDNTNYYEKPHRAGKRAEFAGRDTIVNMGVGISHYTRLDRPRLDWVMVDIAAVSAAYNGPRPAAPIVAAAVPANVENLDNLLSEDKRRLREELARMRSQSGNTPAEAASPQPAMQAAGPSPRVLPDVPRAPQSPGPASVQERLRLLKDLYDQDLITGEEYDRKRAEILDQI